MYAHVCHMCVGAHRGQKGVSDPLELKLQVVESHSACVVGTEFGSSVRAVSALN